MISFLYLLVQVLPPGCHDPFREITDSKGKLSDEAYQRRLRGPIIVLILDVLIIVAAASPKFRRKLFGFAPGAAEGEVKLTGRVLIFPASLVVAVILFAGIIPGIVQALVANPNEITMDAPYLKNSIEFTRAPGWFRPHGSAHRRAAV